MRGLKYQLKNTGRDKLCVLTFLLPILVGIAIRLLSGVSFSSLGENAFYTVKDELPKEAIEWLREYGAVTEYDNREKMEAAVKDPSTQGIGVIPDGEGIKTLIGGDEYEINERTGDVLPEMYENRDEAAEAKVNILPREADNEGLLSLLIVITIVTAMFMGCTFNAMNIIGEKEDGIAHINEILPMSGKEYIVQKTLLGFLGGAASTMVTALVCMEGKAGQAGLLFIIIVLSAFIAAMAGLLIGRAAGGLMVGIVYIKVVMILFMGPPILFYMTLSPDTLAYRLSFLLPSSAAFYGLMELLGGSGERLWGYAAVLLGHCLFWTCLGLKAIAPSRSRGLLASRQGSGSR